MNKMLVRHMKESDIPKVAQLHQKSLTDIPTGIGMDYLTEFYKKLVAHTLSHVCLVGVSGGEIVGVITSTRNFKQTQALIYKLTFSPKIVLKIMCAIISGKISIRDILHRMLFEKKLGSRYNPFSAYILTLFVVQEYRRKGVGKRLVTKLLDYLKRGGVKKVSVDTRSDNMQGRRFYSAVGFKELLSAFNTILFIYRVE